MRYVYNAERDRIACKVWEPHFAIATFEDVQTKDLRAMMLYACTNLDKHMRTTAEKYANEEEVLKEVKEISRSTYEKWLWNEGSYIEIEGQEIPVRYVTEFLIAEDSPEPGKSKDSRYGDLSHKKMLLMEKDANLIQAIAESWERAKPENDVVRDLPDPAYEPVFTDLE